MNKEEIETIERELPPDGLAGMLYHYFNKDDMYYMVEIASLPTGGVGLVLKGTAPVNERREQFLMMYKGIENIADFLKRNAK